MAELLDMKAKLQHGLAEQSQLTLNHSNHLIDPEAAGVEGDYGEFAPARETDGGTGFES